MSEDVKTLSCELPTELHLVLNRPLQRTFARPPEKKAI